MPTMNKNNGMMRSHAEKPSHSTCSSWYFIHSGGCDQKMPNAASSNSCPPTIQNISKPRSASMALTRSRGVPSAGASVGRGSVSICGLRLLISLPRVVSEVRSASWSLPRCSKLALIIPCCDARFKAVALLDVGDRMLLVAAGGEGLGGQFLCKAILQAFDSLALCGKICGFFGLCRCQAFVYIDCA